MGTDSLDSEFVLVDKDELLGRTALGSGPEWTCSESGCRKVFWNLSRYRLHLVKSHRLINCPREQNLFSSRSAHPVQIPKYLCPEEDCKYGKKQRTQYFKERRLLKQHYMKVHCEKKLVCGICNVLRFSLERDKKYHEKMCALSNTHTPAKKVELVSEPERAQPKEILLVCVPLVTSAAPPAAKRLRRIAPKSCKKDMCIQTESTCSSLSQSSQCGGSLMEASLSSEASFAQSSVTLEECSGHDIFCQTSLPLVVDASVCTDLSAYLEPGRTDRYTNTPAHDWASTPFEIDPTIFSTIETQTDTSGLADSFDFEELLRNIETQTYSGGYFTDIETQTSLIDFEGAGISSTTETQT